MGFGLSLDYKWDKLLLVAAQQNFYAGETSSYGSTAPVLFGTAQANSGGTNVRDNQTYLAGTYDFGIVKTYLQYITRKASNAENANLYSKYTATQIGVSANLTPVIGVFASAGMGKYYAYNATVVNPGANITGMQLGTTYALSKRTNLYALYGQSATGNSAVATSGTTAAVSSYNQNNYAVGVKHTF
jgi:acyl-CoA-binding protein